MFSACVPCMHLFVDYFVCVGEQLAAGGGSGGRQAWMVWRDG
jgi:hypothetical protein